MGDSKNYPSENFSCNERWSSNSGQESSWTSYFVDFLMNGQEKNDSSTGHDDSSSVVSDVATSAVKKSVEIDQAGAVCGLQKTMNSYPGQEEDKLSKDDATTSGRRDKISIDLDFVGRGGGNFSELKKRGLRLVPLSMMVKYQD
ncbi:hypothetical protein ACJRO7_023016 [Eucalyptus globulus]|uniref:Uncharacterized protein n=1 Tax=Eucalyptus globulus TaxID=34317 RepID=A0ABD3K5H7_EUCGL